MIGARVTAATLDPSVVATIRGLLDAGRKIDAIKLVREKTGFGLAEAKTMVEAIESGRSMATTTIDLDDADGERIKALLLAGKEIEAVKLLRERSDGRLGLKSARDLTQAYLHHLAEGGAGAMQIKIQADANPAAALRDTAIQRAKGGPLSAALKFLVALGIAAGIVLWLLGWPPRF